jgi:hypothetical protein
LHDVFSTHDKLYFESLKNQNVPGWMFKLLFQEDNISPDCKVLAYWKDDSSSPAVLRNNYGKGFGIRIGTCFFQHYFAYHDPASLFWFRAILPESAFCGIKLINPSTALRLRELTCADRSVVIILNHNKYLVNALVKTDRDGTLTPLNGEKEILLSNSVPISIPVEKKLALQFVFQTDK